MRFADLATLDVEARRRRKRRRGRRGMSVGHRLP